MGQCGYSFKIGFVNTTAARKALPKIRAFLKQDIKAYTFWQDERDNSDAAFWSRFELEFPLITEYLKAKYPSDWGSTNGNTLSGKLDFGQEEELYLNQDGSEINYYANDVSHLNDWGPMVDFLKEKYLAVKGVWGSEESGISSPENLNLFDWEGIVRKILKCKPLLPQMMGMHEELDELIQYEIKK